MTTAWPSIDDAERRANLTAAEEMLAGAASAESAAEAIGRAVLMLTGAPRAAVFFRSSKGAVTCAWSHNLPDAYVRELVTPDGVNPWVHLMRCPEFTCMDMPKGGRAYSAKPWFLADARELPYRNPVRQRLERAGLRAVCTWPLSRAGRVIGAIVYYFDAPHACPAAEEEAMSSFAPQAAAAVPGGPAAADAPRGPFREVRPSVEAGRAGLEQRPAVLDGGQGALSLTQSKLREERDRLAMLQRDLEAEQARLAAERAALEAEYRRLADTRAAFAVENEWLAEVERRLEVEAARTAGGGSKVPVNALSLSGPEESHD
ncbi:MAG TPA: GAF domain-containing protein [bacterium]|nr:GAF domain-containing protein [bacterium]